MSNYKRGKEVLIKTSVSLKAISCDKIHSPNKGLEHGAIPKQLFSYPSSKLKSFLVGMDTSMKYNTWSSERNNWPSKVVPRSCIWKSLIADLAEMLSVINVIMVRDYEIYITKWHACVPCLSVPRFRGWETHGIISCRTPSTTSGDLSSADDWWINTADSLIEIIYSEEKVSFMTDYKPRDAYVSVGETCCRPCGMYLLCSVFPFSLSCLFYSIPV